MQKNQFRSLMILAIAVIALASCTKTNVQGRLIPKEAAVVILLDGKSLTTKLPWDEVKQNALFKMAYTDSTIPPTAKRILDNPENAGIDIKNDLLMFVLKDSLGIYLAFEGNVKDEKAFKTFNKEITENGTESEVNGVQYINKSPLSVGWTKEKFVYVFNAPAMAGMDDFSRRMMNDSIDISIHKTRDIGATCKGIFALAEGNSLAKNEKFTALMKESGDMRFWMNPDQMTAAGVSNSPLEMLNMDRFLKGYIITATLNFENGKIAGTSKTYANGEIADLFKKYSGGKINEEMIKRIPGTDPMVVMALNFKPEGLKELVKLTNMDGLINIGLSKTGFTLDDFIKANKGDIVFGLSDFLMKNDTMKFHFKDQDEVATPYQKPSFNFIFAASIADKDAFNKLINAGKTIGQKQMPDTSAFPLAYNSNGTYFVMSNTNENVTKYLSTSGTSHDFISKINDEPFGGFINIQALLKAFGGIAAKDSLANIAYDASLKMWDKALWKGGNFKDGGIMQSFEVNLVDKNTNSLKQLNQYAAKLSEVFREKKRKMKEDMGGMEDVQMTFPDTTTHRVK